MKISERQRKLNEALHRILGGLLTRGVLRDPRVQGVLLTAVRVTPDLQVARCYLRSTSETKNPDALVEVMRNASGALRKRLGAELTQKYTPQLEFFWDDTIDKAAEIERIFDQLHRESKDVPQTTSDEGNDE